MWSSVWRFKTIIAPPEAPSLLFPADGAIINVRRDSTLRWNASAGAVSYQVQISTDRDFSSIVLDTSGITKTEYKLSGLGNGTVYYWHIKASNQSGTSDWSNTWSFTTIVQLPGQVALISPADLAVIEADSVRFTWRKSTPAIIRYWFEFATDSLMTNVMIDSTLAVSDTVKTVYQLSYNQTYWWRVKAKNMAGWGPFSDKRNFRIVITIVHTNEDIPREFRLSQNYPNPFNPSTMIEYSLPKPLHVELKIYDILGNEVQTLVNDKQLPGVHRVQFDSQSLPGGIYFYRLRAEERVEVKKMMVVG